jgi:hypothetical protein
MEQRDSVKHQMNSGVYSPYFLVWKIDKSLLLIIKCGVIDGKNDGKRRLAFGISGLLLYHLVVLFFPGLSFFLRHHISSNNYLLIPTHKSLSLISRIFSPQYGREWRVTLPSVSGVTVQCSCIACHDPSSSSRYFIHMSRVKIINSMHTRIEAHLTITSSSVKVYYSSPNRKIHHITYCTKCIYGNRLVYDQVSFQQYGSFLPGLRSPFMYIQVLPFRHGPPASHPCAMVNTCSLTMGLPKPVSPWLQFTDSGPWRSAHQRQSVLLCLRLPNMSTMSSAFLWSVMKGKYQPWGGAYPRAYQLFNASLPEFPANRIQRC